MQENAVDSPPIAEEQQPDVSSPEASDPPELAFSDAATATRWVKSLPLSNVGQAYQAILDQLRALTASQMGPRDRATIAELIREPVAHLHTELARRYAGKPQPLDEREAEAADQAITLWQALWIQYSVCLKPLLDGSTRTAGRQGQAAAAGAVCRQAADHRAWLRASHSFGRPVAGAARVLPACRNARLRHGKRVRSPDAGCRKPFVLFDVQPRPAAGTRRPLCAECAADRAHGSLAGPVGAEGVSLRQAARERRCRHRHRPRSARMVRCSRIRAPERIRRSVRFGYPAKLATSVRGRLKRLANGATPAELQLGRRRVGRSGRHAAEASRYALASSPRGRTAPAFDSDRGFGGRYRGRVFPRRWPLVQSSGSARPRHRSDALPADGRRHRGFRPAQGAGGAQLALGKVVRRVRVARGDDQAPERRSATTGSSISSSSFARMPRRGSATFHGSPSSRTGRSRCRSSCGPATRRCSPCGWSIPTAPRRRRPPAILLAESPEEPAVARAVAARVRAEPRHALRRAGPDPEVQAAAHRPARRRLRARRVRARRPEFLAEVEAARPTLRRIKPRGFERGRPAR